MGFRCPMPLGCDHFLLGRRQCVKEGLHRRLAEAPASLMWPRLIVFAKPQIKIDLQLVDRTIHLFAEGDAVELVEHGLVEALADAVGLRALGLGRGSGDGASAGWRVIVSPALEAPAIVAGLDDVAVVGQAVEQRSGHFGITEDARKPRPGGIHLSDPVTRMERSSFTAAQCWPSGF